MFAQQVADATSTAAAWAGVIGPIVNIGFAAVVAWYLLSKAIPKMQAEHAASFEKQQAANAKGMEDQRKDFLAEIQQKRTDTLAEKREAREEYKLALKAVTDHCKEEASRRDDTFRVEMAQVTGALKDFIEMGEELRNEIRALREQRQK